MILKIKNIRKWRVSKDELNWIIQEHKPQNKPPKNWVNRFYYQELENLFKGLLDLGINEKNLTDFRGILDRQREIYAGIRSLEQNLAKELGVKRVQVPEITKLSKVSVAPKKKARKPAKSKKKQAGAK
jgi:hypothetical protein